MFIKMEPCGFRISKWTVSNYSLLRIKDVKTLYMSSEKLHFLKILSALITLPRIWIICHNISSIVDLLNELIDMLLDILYLELF